jgi:hypothetical protein
VHVRAVKSKVAMVDDSEAIFRELVRSLEDLCSRSLNDDEQMVLRGLLRGLNYRQMSQTGVDLGRRYRANTLKNAAYRLWPELSRLAGTKVRKRNFAGAVRAWYLRETQSAQLPNSPHPLRERTSSTYSPTTPLAGLPTVSDCPGREAELADLRQRIESNQRMIAVYGPPRIGKTDLVTVLFEQVRSNFEGFATFSGREVPTVEDFYRGIKRQIFLSAAEEALPATVPPQQALVDMFRRRRLLILIDGTEAIAQANPASTLAAADSNYSSFLQQFLEDLLCQSCLIWVGQTPPPVEPQRNLHTYSLSGLAKTDAAALLQSYGLIPSDLDWEALLAFCDGNPGWLRLAAEQIVGVHRGAIAAFLTAPSLPETFCSHWVQAIERLTADEKAVLCHLVLQPLTAKALSGFFPDMSSYRLKNEVLAALDQRGLIERDGIEVYRLHPLALNHVAARYVVEQLWQGLIEGQVANLRRYPLLLAQAPDYLQDWHRQGLLLPLAERLQQRYPGEVAQSRLFAQTLDTLKQQPTLTRCYGAGNLLNLAGALNLALNELDFSGLSIYQADLRRVNIRSMVGQGCRFGESRFPEGLVGPLEAVLSPDGALLAISDAAGRVLRWRRIGEQLHLDGVAILPEPVTALHCTTDLLLTLAAGRRVYMWASEENTLESICEASAPVTCIAQDTQGKLAIGLATGGILIRDGLVDEIRLRRHTTEISNLAFSHDGHFLASRGRGQQIQRWNLLSLESDLEPIQTFWIFLALGWQADRLLLAEVNGDQFEIKVVDHQTRTLEAATGQIIESAFSNNCRYLVGSSTSGVVSRWDVQRGSAIALPPFPVPPVQLGISDDGRWLMTNTRSVPPYVQLWDVETQHRIWSVGNVDDSGCCIGLNLQQSQGLSPAEAALLRYLGAQL